MTAPLWGTGPPTPAMWRRFGGPLTHSSYTTLWDVTVSIAMALCVLKTGRAISYAGRHRRPCLVAVIRAHRRPPMVLLDVDHTDDASLSSLVLTFHNPVPLPVMEQPIKALLDGMVANSGRWDLSTLESFVDTCGHMRLPKVLRHQKRMEQTCYHKAWALRLIDRLKLGDL